MLRMLVTLLCLLPAAVAVASACPQPGASGSKIDMAGTRLATAHRAQVIAGGGVALAACGRLPGEGNVAPHPNFNVMIAGWRHDPLEFRSEGDCDTVLVVASAGGGWHYDDDGAGNGGARIVIPAPQDGRYDVWVGTFGRGTCRARFVLKQAS